MYPMNNAVLFPTLCNKLIKTAERIYNKDRTLKSAKTYKHLNKSAYGVWGSAMLCIVLK